MIKSASLTVIIFLVAIVGFLVGRAYPMNNTQKAAPQSQDPNILFKNQTATFEGKITSVRGNLIEVEAENGQKGEIKLSDKLIIYKFPNNSPTSVASHEIDSVEAGKKTLIDLKLVNGKYEAVSISYFREP